MLSLSPEWLDQYGLHGGKVLVWVETHSNRNQLVVMPYSNALEAELRARGFDFVEQPLEPFGPKTKLIELPEKWQHYLAFKEDEYALQLTDYGLAVERPSRERLRQLHDGLTELYFSRGKKPGARR